MHKFIFSKERLLIPTITVALVALFVASAARATAQDDTWYSKLYPEDWQPGHYVLAGEFDQYKDNPALANDRLFLHDFSYAGYHYGEDEIPVVNIQNTESNPLGVVLNVLEKPFYADNTGNSDSTAAIQKAIDAAVENGGGIVYLPEGTYKLTTRPAKEFALWIHGDGVVLKGDGPDKTKLFWYSDLTEKENFKDKTMIHISPYETVEYALWNNPLPDERQVKIKREEPNPTQIIQVKNYNRLNFQEGDWISIYSQASAEWAAELQMPNWESRFKNHSITYYRQIIKLHPETNEIEINIPTRYPILERDKAIVTKVEDHIEEIGIQDLAIGGSEVVLEVPPGEEENSLKYDCHIRNDTASHGNLCMNLNARAAMFTVNHTIHSWVKNVKSYKADSNETYHYPSNGIKVFMAHFLTLEDLDLRTPQSLGGGGNGYHVTFTGNDNLLKDSTLVGGRHNISISQIFSMGNVVHNVVSTGVGDTGGDDFHGYLSPANLIDNLTQDNNHFVIRNRGDKGGHTSTETVMWNTHGIGSGAYIRTEQYRYGYYIGTSGDLTVQNNHPNDGVVIPDLIEGAGIGQTLEPQSLYLDQFEKRKNRPNGFVYMESTPTNTLPASSNRWRSGLYLEDWEPGDTDPSDSSRFLHDFSYAGYHYGEDRIPVNPPGRIYNVLDYGAINSGPGDSTAAIQSAIDDAGRAGGGIVHLPAGTYTVTNTADQDYVLWIKHSNVVLRGEGTDTKLFWDQEVVTDKALIHASPFPKQENAWAQPVGDQVKLTQDLPTMSKSVPVEDTTPFKVGDWVVIKSTATPEFSVEHGMGEDLWNRKGGITFYRQITKIDAANKRLEINVPTRYILKTRDEARVYKVAPHLEEVGIENMEIGVRQHPNTQGDCDEFRVSPSDTTPCLLATKGSHLIMLNHVIHSWVKDIKTFKHNENESTHLPSKGISIETAAFLTIDSVDIRNPQNLAGGSNGYLLSIRGSDSLYQNSYLANGRHNISFGRFHASGNVIYNVKLKDLKEYGVSDFHMQLSPVNLVDNLYLDNAGFQANFRPYPSGPTPNHGHSTTESVFWNTTGMNTDNNTLVSQQFGWGYVIGTSGQLTVTTPTNFSDKLTGPQDFFEGANSGKFLNPQSLYLDQLAKRKNRGELLMIPDVGEPLPMQTNRSSTIIYQQRDGLNSWIWNVNPDNDTVTAYDVVTNEKVKEIKVDDQPSSLAEAGNGIIWVTNKASGTINLVNRKKDTVKRTIRLPIGSQPHGVVFDPAGDFLYVALEGRGEVWKFDRETRKVVGTIDVGPFPRHLTIDADGERLYVSRFITPPQTNESGENIALTGGEIVVVDPNTMNLVKTVIIQPHGRGLPNYLGAMAISPDGSTGWVPSKSDNLTTGSFRDGSDLTGINAVRAVSSILNLADESSASLDQIRHKNAGLASAAQFSSDGSQLFVALETSRQVAIINSATNEQVTRVDVGRAPQGLAISPDGRFLFVHNYMDRSVSIIELGSDIKVATTFETVATEQLPTQVFEGKQLFYDAKDPRLASRGTMSCASCHSEGGHDGRIWDFANEGEGLRNTISLIGHGGADHGRLNWTGNYDEVHDFENQIRSFAEGAGLIPDSDFIVNNYPIRDIKKGVSADLDALAIYVNSLTTVGKSPYREADGNMTPEGLLGKDVFKSASCSSCHSGTSFTDPNTSSLYDIGTMTTLSGDRLGNDLIGIDVPTLLGLWNTAPYLHDGSAATLEEAIKKHTKGVDSVDDLNDEDIKHLASYLLQLDDSATGKEQRSRAVPSTVVHMLGDPINIQVGQGDLDGNQMKYSATGLPSGTTIDQNSGRISGEATTPGSYSVEVAVSAAPAERRSADTNKPAETVSFEWIISEKYAPVAPWTPNGQIRWDRYAGDQSDPTPLKDQQNFPFYPTSSNTLESFETPIDLPGPIGQRLSGYIYPPVTGQYRFWIASEDNGELWLSQDASRGNRELIAHVPGWTYSQEWEKFPEQRSVVITLQANRPYYIEAFADSNSETGNLAVAWQIPGQELEIIDAKYMAKADPLFEAEKDSIFGEFDQKVFLPLIQSGR